LTRRRETAESSIPLVLVVILVVLMMLLRALLAPLLLIATVVLSSRHPGHLLGLLQPHLQLRDADPSFRCSPSSSGGVGHLDYNTSPMTRVREETLQSAPDPVSCGGFRHRRRDHNIRLAWSLRRLSPCSGCADRLLAEIGFAVAFGVLLDTFIVRSLLVPASPTTSVESLVPSRLARASSQVRRDRACRF